MLARILWLALVGLGACASLKNTPVQDYVWEMGKKCEHVNSGWRMDRVDVDGRYWISGTNVTSPADFGACMQEQYRNTPYKAWLETNKASYPAGAK
jgi:hypothetical protein